MKAANEIKAQFINENEWLFIKHIDVDAMAVRLEDSIDKKLEPVRKALEDQCRYMNSIGHEPSESAYDALAMLSEES